MRSRISSLLILMLILALTMQCAKEESKLDMKQIAEKWRTTFNSHDGDELVKLFSDDVVLIAPVLPEPVEGKKEVMDVIQGMWSAMPDFRVELKVFFTSEEYFAWEVNLRGEFTNPDFVDSIKFSNIFAAYYSMVQQRLDAYKILMTKNKKLLENLTIK